MKKLFTLSILILLGVVAFSQGSQRMVLWEQFTNTSCGPCATYNPSVEAYLEDHVDDIVQIAYHVWWPGNGDPFYQANIEEQTWRTNYYGCNSVPWTTIDGNQYNQWPSGNNMSTVLPVLEDRLEVLSPFSINLSHTKSPNNDIVYVTMDIDCTDDVSGNLKAFIIVIEKEVNFANPPGNNGETHFVNVFKKFLPDNNATDLPASISIGDNIIVEESWELANFYDHTNLAVVAFIQNTSTKEIYQAAFSAPSGPDFVEPELLEVTRPVTEICGDEFQPKVVIRNLGGVNLTSLDFEYSIDGGDTYTYAWEGDLEYTEADEVLLPAISYTPESSNTFDVEILNPNGIEDPNPANNTASVEFEQATETSTNVEMQLFVGAWADQISWEFYSYEDGILASGSDYGNNEVINMELPITSSACYGFTLYDSQGDGFSGGGYLKLKDNGTVFAYITSELEDIIDIPFHTNNPLAGPTEFDGTMDNFDIDFAWTAPSKSTLLGYNIFLAEDMETPINTSLIETTAYSYTVAGNGLYEFYLTAEYDEGTSDYIGPLSLDFNVGLNNLSNNDFNIYPNPVSEIATLSFNLNEIADVQLSIYNLIGVLVMEIPISIQKTGEQNISINTSSLEEGIYFVNLMINKQMITKKITVMK